MCLNPRQLDDGTQVACRECWQCRRSRVDDIVGRGTAEMKTAVASHAVTLTYGRGRDVSKLTYGEAEHERAAVLTYSDIQKMMKLLRRHGYPARYLVSGEYGTRKGRAHWHILLFWQERAPKVELGQNWMFQRFDDAGQPVTLQSGEPAMFWPHGHTFWAEPSYEAFRYNLKYVLKAQGQGADEAQSKVVWSKGEPLGAAYFRSLARDYAKQGLAPRDGLYTFPEAVRRNGERVKFRLAGRSEELFVEAFSEAWAEFWPGRHEPASEYIEGVQDRMASAARPLALERKCRLAEPDSGICAMLELEIGERVRSADLKMDKDVLAWAYKARDGRVWFWRRHVSGDWIWQEKESARSERQAWGALKRALWETGRLPVSRPKKTRPGASS